MPTFSTPEPISVQLDLGGAGVIRLVASARTDTVVEVRPTNPASKADVEVAAQTLVEYSDGRVTVRSPSAGWRYYTPWLGRGSVDVELAVPTGSRLGGKAGMGDVHCEGDLAEVGFKTGFGAIRAERTGALAVRSGQGDVTIEHAASRAEISTGGGLVRVGRIDGPAVVNNSNGDIVIADVEGELRAKAANGKIAVDRSHASVSVKSANGNIVLGTVTRGQVVAETACGRVEIGVADGVPAWLELHTSYGEVGNELNGAEAPAPDEDAVEIRARTGFGDIAIHRSFAMQAEAVV